MKNYINILFFICFFFIVSCQTTSDLNSAEQAEDTEEVAADVVGESSDDEFGEEDLESEFSDSEDFEKEMAEEAFTDEDSSLEDEVAADATPTPEREEVAVQDQKQTPEETSSEPAESAEVEQQLVEEEIVQAEVEDSIETDDSELIAEDETDSSSSVGGAGVVINSIRYEAEENKIYVDGTGSFSYQSRENKESNQFVVEIPGAILSESLQERPFVMKDFNTAVALLQADQKDSNTVRIVMQMRENAGLPSVNVSDTGSLVIVAPDGVGGSVADTGVLNSPVGGRGDGSSYQNSYGGGSSGGVLPAKSLEEFFLHTPQFSGKPISIHFYDVDVRYVLDFISENTGLNMVLSDDVAGNISIKLRNVPWDQALVTVMKMKKLGYIREGNVIRIMSLTALRQDQQEMQKMMESQKTLEPLKVKVIPLVYTKAEDIKKQVDVFLTKDRGQTVVDPQSNSIIVTDTARAINRIETMLNSLDKSPVQVMIEAKIVEARETFVRSLGISWEFNGAAFDTVSQLGWDPRLALAVDGSLSAFPSARGSGGNVSGRTISQSLGVSFVPLGDLDLTLGLSETEGLAHVISAPRIMVLNGETATITQTTEAISVVTQQSGDTGNAIGTSASKDEAKLSFEVSPQITALGSVFLDIKMTREFFGAIADESTQARPKNSRQADTKVLVNNGQTIVIGGIYQHDETRSDEGFPILRHIPILKWLFSRFTTDQQRNELLLFLTPRVLDFTPTKNSIEIN